MATQQIAWAINGTSDLTMLFPESQGPPYTHPDWNVQDLTISPDGTLMVLAWEGNATVIYYTPQNFPMEWKWFLVSLDGGVQGVKIDAGPGDSLYMITNTGAVGRVPIPADGGEQSSFELIEGVEGVMQISAAADGIVWVVACDPNRGSVVCWWEKGKWKTIPELANALRVTGSKRGKAFVINSDGELYEFSKKGEAKRIHADFPSSQLSVGPNGRLWVRSGQSTTKPGTSVYWTDDKGENWHEIDGSGVLQLDAGTVDWDFDK